LKIFSRSLNLLKGNYVCHFSKLSGCKSKVSLRRGQGDDLILNEKLKNNIEYRTFNIEHQREDNCNVTSASSVAVNPKSPFEGGRAMI
jgi:hypothetical protein